MPKINHPLMLDDSAPQYRWLKLNFRPFREVGSGLADECIGAVDVWWSDIASHNDATRSGN